MRTVALGGIVLAVASSCQSQIPAEQESVSSIREFEITALERLGGLMFEQDRQAAVATDVLVARLADPEKQQLRGCVVESSGKESRVRFVRERNDTIEAAYDVVFDGGDRPRLSEAANRELGRAKLAQLRARRLAIANIDPKCSDRYNTMPSKILVRTIG
jgi:hypothetical protein